MNVSLIKVPIIPLYFNLYTSYSLAKERGVTFDRKLMVGKFFKNVLTYCTRLVETTICGNNNLPKQHDINIIIIFGI